MQPPADKNLNTQHAGDDHDVVVEFYKGRHLWRFRCDRGAEEHLVDSIAQLAAGGRAPLDWFDAAVLSEEILGRDVTPPSGHSANLSTFDHLHSMQTGFDLPEIEA